MLGVGVVHAMHFSHLGSYCILLHSLPRLAIRVRLSDPEY